MRLRHFFKKRFFKGLLSIVIPLCAGGLFLSDAFANADDFNITVSIYSAQIITPANGKTCSRIPTITGKTFPDVDVEIKGIRGNSEVVVATTHSDINGRFAVQVASDKALDIGANSLVPYVSGLIGKGVQITVKESPVPAEEPVIDSPLNGAQLTYDRPRVKGRAKPPEYIELYRKFPDGLIQKFGAGNVYPSGKFLLGAWDNFTAAGVYYIYVVVDGVASYMIKLEAIDPAGRVYDSQTGESIEGAQVTLQRSTDGGNTWNNAVPGFDILPADLNPQVTGPNGGYAFFAVPGLYKLNVSKNGYIFPSTIIPFGLPHTGSHGEQFNIISEPLVIDLPADFKNETLLRIDKKANKKEVHIGDIITYTVTMKNISAEAVTGIYLKDELAPGLKYLAGKVLLDGQPIPDPEGSRLKKFTIGTIAAGATRTLRYQVIVGSGVTFGEYKNRAWGEFSSARQISNVAQETVKVIPEPIFDLGIVIGKVFWDFNENGIQDSSLQESGIANVQIVTEEGTIITTDKDGKFHLAGIIPGRHLFRIDERSLSKGAYLTTEKIVIVNITPGLLAKVNFGVNKKDSKEGVNAGIKILNERKVPLPRLNTALFGEKIVFKNNVLAEPVEFRIFANYHFLINKWRLEILDKNTRALIKKFEGESAGLNQPIFWDGKTEKNQLISQERDYIYILRVFDKEKREDVTKPKGIKVYWLKQEVSPLEEEQTRQRENYYRWLERENKANNLDKQNIKLQNAETINVAYQRLDLENIRIKSDASEVQIPVFYSQTITVSEAIARQGEAASLPTSTIDIILPKGEYELEVIFKELDVRRGMSEAKEGGFTAESLQRDSSKNQQFNKRDREMASNIQQPTSNQKYTEHIKVGDDHFFLVALADAKMGYTVNKGNIEPVKQDDKFKKGFWQEGKLAYYLKGKIKGKYLITSSLDTQRNEYQKTLFKNLDPKKYYPVYGDASTINYDATNTQGLLYLLIEWDKSSVLWGNYDTNLTQTEFAAYNRSLYGGKVYYEDVSQTSFGEPKTKLAVFRASIPEQQKAGHNEFLGTGGSLYYLKHRDIIEGSEKIKIEVRDKITGLVLITKQLAEDIDFEIDYSQGRIIFWKPILQISQSDLIISPYLLDGNRVYMVADYEYKTIGQGYDEYSLGTRFERALTDYFKMGAIYVQEDEIDKNYVLKGVDSTLHLGRDIKIIGEYAESDSQNIENFVSVDGGLSFAEITGSKSDAGKAYGLKAEGYLLSKLGFSGYYKQIERGFSSTSIISQQGKQLFGGEVVYDLSSKTRLKVKQDTQKLIDDANPQTRAQVGAKKTSATTAQVIHKVSEKLKLTGEFRHQDVGAKKEGFKSETNVEGDTLAAKAEYKPQEDLTLGLSHQAMLRPQEIHKTTLEAEKQIKQGLSVRAKESVGTEGTSTGVGVTTKVRNFELTGDYALNNYKSGIGNEASLGSKINIDDKTQVYTTYALTDSPINNKTQSLVLGSKRKLNQNLEFTNEKTFAANKEKITHSESFGLTHTKDGKKLGTTYSQQRSRSNIENAISNIFGLTGDINERWLAFVNFERGLVQNYDGAQIQRYATGFGLGFVDKDLLTQEIKFKASTKIEYRIDKGRQDSTQYLLYNTAEGKVNPDTTLFAKVNLSQTKSDASTAPTAEFKEFVTGLAYRPVDFDRLNMLGKHTYLENSGSSQINTKDIDKGKAHVLALEAIYDLTKKWQIIEKVAYKIGKEKVTGFDYTSAQTWLEILGFKYTMAKYWKLGAEYRWLAQKQAKDYKQGFLIELYRDIGEFLQIGAGYNFTDFNDDLTRLNYRSQGPFIRFTGKFSEGILDRRKRQDR